MSNIFILLQRTGPFANNKKKREREHVSSPLKLGVEVASCTALLDRRVTHVLYTRISRR